MKHYNQLPFNPNITGKKKIDPHTFYTAGISKFFRCKCSVMLVEVTGQIKE